MKAPVAYPAAFRRSARVVRRVVEEEAAVVARAVMRRDEAGEDRRM
jgi:hypothetical protein